MKLVNLKTLVVAIIFASLTGCAFHQAGLEDPKDIEAKKEAKHHHPVLKQDKKDVKAKKKSTHVSTGHDVDPAIGKLEVAPPKADHKAILAP